MSPRSNKSAPTLFALGATVLLLCISTLTSPAALATTAVARKGTAARVTALGGFVKDRALARLLGETLFRDTVEVMSDSATLSTVALPVPGPNAAGPYHDNSAVGQVARAVLASHSLDKYLWLIRRSYDDSMWRGGDRDLIEQHFPLIWRTSILLYESTLSASPHRVRVCAPTGEAEEFDCHDEIGHARMVPIPTQAPLLIRHRPVNIG